ncbi:MAG: early E1A protein [Clostridiaceae bacterium]|nr:early E1A protein [Clostridiaceae bacterium]DAM37347.1 MAG TPA: lysozyme [Caudoviricetes sp.]
MLSTGNGKTQVCVNNLLQTTRGTIPYERVKGIDPRLFDQPAVAAKESVMADIEWLLETFEPRADLSTIDLEDLAIQTGDVSLTASIDTKN